MNYDDLKAYVAASFEIDWMSLIDIVAYYRETADIGTASTDLLLQGATAAAQLVRDGAMIPGDLTPRFQPWPTTPEESAARIEAEAAELAATGGPLETGDIAWFTAPEDFPS
ncbi:hypothetical protein [Allokutzneria sp. NRRL B-24872]|uniref:hypothetical protein n=1 Tax=Allokutzneria sp. NRRL B-24872 TaxID=1137961 RepID=UPI000A39ECE4|nr:hypothetical protein [Allokutzneria sp. NRRL B-24872]